MWQTQKLLCKLRIWWLQGNPAIDSRSLNEYLLYQLQENWAVTHVIILIAAISGNMDWTAKWTCLFCTTLKVVCQFQTPLNVCRVTSCCVWNVAVLVHRFYRSALSALSSPSCGKDTSRHCTGYIWLQAAHDEEKRTPSKYIQNSLKFICLSVCYVWALDTSNE